MILRILKNGQRQAMPFAGMYDGLDCFLVCPGPSLKDVGPAALDCPGAFVLGVNTSYPKVKPNVWIGMDAPDSYDPAIIHERFPKFYGTRYVGVMVDGRKLEEWPQSYFLGPGKNGTPEDFFGPQDDKSEVIWNGNTYETAIHTALRMGAKTIYLVGCDFGGPSDYYDGRTLAEEHRKRNQSLYRILADKTRALAEAAKFHDKEIVSCTPGSPVNQHIGYLPLAEAVARARCNASFNPNRPKVDAELAEKLCWAPMKDPGFGVMLGCDAGQEWLLPWWYENYRAHNDYRVAWIDYGLSPDALAWCTARGTVINCLDLLTVKNVWHRKPFALLRSPWGTTVFMEPDCEVCANLGPLFGQVGNEVLVTDDPYNPWSKQYVEVPIATGLLGFRHGNADLMEWGRYMLAHPDVRSDQEGCNALYGDRKMHVRFVDRHVWQWLRLDIDRQEELGLGDGRDVAKIIHWTGPQGKDIIRKKIEDGRNIPTPGGPARMVAGAQDSSPLVSIVTTAYKCEKFLPELRACIEAQTYKNWEWCVHDDDADHLGYMKGWTKAYSQAKGEFVCMMDADDLMMLERIEKQVAFLLAHPDYAGVSCGAGEDRGQGPFIRPCQPFDPEKFCNGIRDYPHPVMPSLMYRREWIEKAGPLDAPGCHDQGADAGMLMRIMDLGGKIGHIDEPLYLYRRQNGSLTFHQEPGHTQSEEYMRQVAMSKARRGLPTDGLPDGDEQIGKMNDAMRPVMKEVMA